MRLYVIIYAQHEWDRFNEFKYSITVKLFIIVLLCCCCSFFSLAPLNRFVVCYCRRFCLKFLLAHSIVLCLIFLIRIKAFGVVLIVKQLTRVKRRKETTTRNSTKKMEQNVVVEKNSIKSFIESEAKCCFTLNYDRTNHNIIKNQLKIGKAIKIWFSTFFCTLHSETWW